MAYTIMKDGKAPENFAAIDLPNEESSYSARRNLLMEVNNIIFKLFLALMAFVYAEASGFGDNVIEKNLFLMRSVLISTLLIFLMLIQMTVLNHPPGKGGLVQVVTIMVLACSVCVLLVLLVSTITAVITFILWAVVISTVVASRWKEIAEQMRGNLDFCSKKF
jgi:membrane-associated HD superfamily phosphohydrolase